MFASKAEKNPRVGKLAARNADDHFPFGDSRGHRDGVIVLWDTTRALPTPSCRSRHRALEPAVDHGRDDLALIDRDPAIHHAAADLRPYGGLIHFRIPPPLFLACARVDGEYDAPVRDAVHRAVPYKGSRFLRTTARTDVI